MKGIHTVVSNKAFLKFRGPAIETAPIINDLVAKGAVLVGKVKMTGFADREFPPSDWIDYHCPFNPRGDGYLVPEGSSAGSAAAVAAYDWLDASLGTETSASVRGPAAAQGIFGIRTSHGAISTEGVIPLVPRFDVVGFMARDISTMQVLAREMLPQPTSSTEKFPEKLIYNPDWLESEELPEARDIFEAFVGKLEKFLGVEKTIVDVEKEWTEDDPRETGKPFKEEFLRASAPTYERIHGPASFEYQSKWTKEYAENFGKAPYLPPAIKNRGIPNAGRDYGFGQEFSPSFAELPELVICIGQYKYESANSQTTEYAPVAASIIGAKGSDNMLLKLAEDFLAFANIPGKVLTGSTAEEHRLPPDWKL